MFVLCENFHLIFRVGRLGAEVLEYEEVEESAVEALVRFSFRFCYIFILSEGSASTGFYLFS